MARERLVFRWVGWAITSFFRSRSTLIAENLCLRHQLLVLQRRHPRPRLRNADRRFRILACRWLTGWPRSVVIVKPETVLGWHRKGWKAYWRWRSWPRGERGRRPIGCALRSLIRGMALENHWGASGGSRPSWPGWGSRSRLALSPNTCAGHASGDHRPAGEAFSDGMVRISGPATSSASRLYGSKPSMP